MRGTFRAEDEASIATMPHIFCLTMYKDKKKYSWMIIADVLVSRLPSPLIYMILEWVPCMSVDVYALKHQRFYMKTMRIIRSLHISDDNKRDIYDVLKTFDFLKETHFEMEHADFFLSVFYRNTHRFNDYIMIYL